MDGVAALGIFFPIMVLIVVFLFVLAIRYISYRERIALLEKGVDPESIVRKSNAPTIRGGLASTFIGLAVFLGLLTIGFGPWLLFGLIPMFAGIAQLIAYYASKPAEGNEQPPEQNN